MLAVTKRVLGRRDLERAVVLLLEPLCLQAISPSYGRTSPCPSLLRAWFSLFFSKLSDSAFLVFWVEPGKEG